MKNSKLIYNLGKRIAFLRKKKKLSQEEFADASGKMINTISKIERGISDPKVSTLEAIAATLDMSVSQLFCDAENYRTDINPVIEEIINILKKENTAAQKAALKQIEILFSIRKN